jgi:hypothetical protein
LCWRLFNERFGFYHLLLENLLAYKSAMFHAEGTH